MADEPVVVMKSRPEKPGNSVEDKTGMTVSKTGGADVSQKPHRLRRGEVYSKAPGNCLEKKSERKSLDAMRQVIGGRLRKAHC